MLTPTAPLVLPSTEAGGGKLSGDFTRRHGVILLAALEMLGCLAAVLLYVYALTYDPSWAPVLVPIPDGLCSEVNIVHAFMYVFSLFFVMEFFLAIYLFDGARRESLDRVRFWLSSTLTTLTLVSLVVIGLELGGIRSPTMNSIAFINIFLRFLEIMIVYAWSEQESMRRLRISIERRSGGGSGGGGCRRTSCLDTSGLGSRQMSTATIHTLIEEPATPPPSYLESIPEGTPVTTLPPLLLPSTISACPSPALRAPVDSDECQA